VSPRDELLKPFSEMPGAEVGPCCVKSPSCFFQIPSLEADTGPVVNDLIFARFYSPLTEILRVMKELSLESYSGL